MNKRLIKILNDFRLRFFGAIFFLLLSILDLIINPIDSTYGGIFPALIFSVVVLFPLFRYYRVYKIVFFLARRRGFSRKRIYTYLLMGLHGKLLGINIVSRNMIQWILIISGYIIGMGWLIQSDLSTFIKIVLALVATYKFIRTINS